jgi:tryptophan 2,3-dioxygenase
MCYNSTEDRILLKKINISLFGTVKPETNPEVLFTSVHKINEGWLKIVLLSLYWKLFQVIKYIYSIFFNYEKISIRNGCGKS